MDFDEMVDQYHGAMDEFARGSPKPLIALYSQRDDVTLAAGMGGVTRGAENVIKATESAATQFREGRTSFDTITKYAGENFGYLLEVERYEAKLFGSEEMGVSIIRVTTIFRREDGVWRVALRHGDPTAAMRAVINAVPYSVVSIREAVK